MTKSWHFGPNDDDEYDPDYEEEHLDDREEFPYDRDLDFNTNGGWSILDNPEVPRDEDSI